MKRNLLLLLAIPAALCAQTTINGSRIIKGSLDASGSTRSLPNRTGTGSPAGRDNCASPGETYFQTDATAGQNLWACTAAGTPGTWNQLTGGSGSSSNASVVTGTTSPNGSCSAGSFYLRTDIQQLYVCSGTNVWELASYASGNTASRPIGCVSGQLYVATDTGDLWYCAVAGSLGTWLSVTPLTSISLNGAAQGAFSTLNLVNPPGANWTLTPNGQTLSLSSTPDTTYLLSQTAAQTGAPFLCVPASGNSSAYACNLTPTPAALSNGMLVQFRPDVSCAGGATTLNINGLGAKPIYSVDGASNPAANDCRASRPTWLIYSSALNSGAGAFVVQSVANLHTLASVMPNTAPGTGQIPIGNSAAYAPETLSGDATLSSTGALSLATVNSSPGTCGSATQVCQVTTNGKGLVTSQSQVPITSTPTGVFTGSTATAPAFSATPTFSLANISSQSPVRFEPGQMSANVASVTFSNLTAGAKFSIVWTQASSGGPYTVNYGSSVSNSSTPCQVSPTAGATTEQFFEVGSTGSAVYAVNCYSNDTPFLISQAHERGAPSTPAANLEALWPDQGRLTWTGINSAGNIHILPRTAGATDQLASTDLSDSSSLMRNNPMTTAGDMIMGGPGGALTRLPAPSSSGTYCPNWSSGTISWITCPGGGGSGLTSIGLTMPSWFTVTGSPLTVNGTLAVSANTESANTVLAGPTTGSAAGPTFRALVSSDMPATIAANTTGNSATATALATTPSQCSGGQFATGIAAGGNANCATPSGGGSNYQTVEANGTAQTQRSTLNLISGANSTVSCVDNSGASRTDCTISSTASGTGLGDPGANGIVKRTALNTTTAATSSDVVGLFSSCSGTQYLGADGNCHTASSGSSIITENTYIPFGGQSGVGSTAIAGAGVWNNASNATAYTAPFDYTTSTLTAAVTGLQFAYATSNGGHASGPEYYYVSWLPPQNWTGTLGVVFNFLGASGSGNMWAKVATMCPGATALTSATWNTESAFAIASPGQWKLGTSGTGFSSVNVSGCSAGTPMMIRIGRDSTNTSDTLLNNMNVLGIQLQYQHT